MRIKEFIYKVKFKICSTFVYKIRHLLSYNWYFMIYRSFWHSKIFDKTYKSNLNKNYMTARPNPGAGIGHQMANWIAGYWFSNFFNLNYAYWPFSSSKIPNTKSSWDYFLGFYQNEITVYQLLKSGYRLVKIPFFNENSEEQLKLVSRIVNSYSNEKVVFLLEQDQFYKDHYNVRVKLQEKFFSAIARKKERILFDPTKFNIAVHVRRGDIVQKPGENNPGLAIRWLDNNYFINVLNYCLSYVKTDKDSHIYIFSQGSEEEFIEFNEYKNIHYCLDMPPMDSFLHMVYADAIITSKSSFSYKPALLNQGLKFCPANFWHGYPDESSWILLDDNGMPLNECKV